MQSLKEQFLLTRIRMFEDEKAFEQIMRDNFPAVKRFLIMKLPTVADAEDAYSITALRLWNYLRSSRVESVSGLIFTIARSVVAEYYRKNNKSEASYSQDPAIQNLASDEGQGAEQITKEIDGSFLRRVINSLPERDANIIRWRYLDGLSMREIAKILNIKEGSATSAVQRSREKLKELLQQQHD